MSEVDNDIIEQIKDTIEKLAIFIRKDGGDIKFYSFDNETGIVKVTLSGACQGCMFIDQTITYGVEAILQEEVKGVNKVAVVDKDGNPIEMNSSLGYDSFYKTRLPSLFFLLLYMDHQSVDIGRMNVSDPPSLPDSLRKNLI